ncbi:unnamed protein product, partial [Laminaria digitata]
RHQHSSADLTQNRSSTQQQPAQRKLSVDEFAMPGVPSHREHTPRAMSSRARRIGRRRAQQPQQILPHICMISVVMAALALSLPFCDSASSPTGHAMASTITERLEGERAIAYAALGGGTSTTSADLRFRSPWRPWQRRVEGGAPAGVGGRASARSSNCACSSCREALARHAQRSSTAHEASRHHPAEDRIRQARRMAAAFVSPAGRPLARGHQEAADRLLSVTSAFNSAVMPRPAATHQQAPQRPQQCSAPTATRYHLEACSSSPRSKAGRSRSQLQTSCYCDGDALSDSPSSSSPSITTAGRSLGSSNNVHPRRRRYSGYSWTESPRVAETTSFSTTMTASQRASQQASQRASQRAPRDATALWASAGDSGTSSAGSGESGASPEEEQGGGLASVRAPLLVTIG